LVNPEIDHTVSSEIPGLNANHRLPPLSASQKDGINIWNDCKQE